MERLYLDTSVFGGFFEPEFELWTKILFKGIKAEQYSILYSLLTDSELRPAPQKVRDLVREIPESVVEIAQLSEEALELADTYIKHGVIGKSSRADCLHIALATLYRADILVSWNFKHIVNIHRIRGYNSVNLRYGHPMLEIRSPRDIIRNESET